MTNEIKCRGCGCTEDAACMTPAGPCYWVVPGLCSRCAASATAPLDVLPETREALEKAFGISLDVQGALFVIRAIQVACLDEDFVGPAREYSEAWARGLQDGVSLTGQIRFLLNQGWPDTRIPPEVVRLLVPGDPGFQLPPRGKERPRK